MVSSSTPAPETHSAPSGFSRIRAGADVVLRGLEHRGQLAALEADEARAEITAAGLLCAAAGALCCFAGFALTLLVAALFWDTPHRVSALGWLAGLELAMAAAGLVRLRQRWRRWRPLAAIREQLYHDAQCLHQIFQKSD